MDYKVGFWYTEYGMTRMEADSVKEAEEKVRQALNEDGSGGLLYDCTDRDFGVGSVAAVTP